MKTRIKKIITSILVYMMIISFALPMSACSKDQSDEEYEEENEKPQKDRKKKKKDDDESKKDESSLKDKLDQMMTVQTDPEEAFNEYVKSLNFIKGSSADFDTNGIPSEYGYDYESDYSHVSYGVLEYKIADFDLDGADEMLVCETKDAGTIIYSMYECDTKVRLADQYVVEDGYMSGDGVDAFSFIYDHDSKVWMAYYSDGGVWNYADGQFVYFVGLIYENEKFEKISEGGFAGSDVYDDEEFLSDLRKCGINTQWENLTEAGLLRATGGERLFKIDMNTTGIDTKPDEYVPYCLHRHVSFNGMASLEEVEAELDAKAHEDYIFPYRKITDASISLSVVRKITHSCLNGIKRFLYIQLFSFDL